MLITFEGHACFSIKTEQKRILIDPFISANPLCKKKVEDFHPDIILVTHGHSDHIGDALEIARACNASLVAQVDLLYQLDTQGIDTVAMNIGGTATVQGVRVRMVQAIHGSSVQGKNGLVSAGTAVGFIIEDKSGNLYHAGDTALFGDMASVIAGYNIYTALLPIGDFYTMGPKDAARAAHWLKAKYVVPMHYATFPIIEQDVLAFQKLLESRSDCKCIPLQPGESWCYDQQSDMPFDQQGVAEGDGR